MQMCTRIQAHWLWICKRLRPYTVKPLAVQGRLQCFAMHQHALQVISDLLKPERTNLGIREDRKRGIYVDGLSEWVVRTPEEVRPGCYSATPA